MAAMKGFSDSELATAALTYEASLVRTLIEKGVLTPDEAKAVAVRAAESLEGSKAVTGRAGEAIRAMLLGEAWNTLGPRGGAEQG